jgi:aminoglycoside phosphotransferase (APT) family kinase protein
VRKEVPVTTGAVTRRPDEEVLRACLEGVVADLGGGSPVAAVERQRSQFSSFYASDVITVRLASGEELKVFLKDFGSYDHPKDGLTGRRERERVVYRDLLVGADLGTARYYGSVWDEAEGRFWLLLEYVEGEPVKHYGFDYWVPPAAWLGRMQGYFARHAELWANCDVLIHHDAAFFHATAEQALRSVSQFSPEFVRRLEPVARRYDPAVRVMASQPPTFVHGTYRPAQIIVDKSCEPTRYCPVDWEKAAVGSGLYDLTFLADGFEPPRLDVILDAYRDEARAAGLAVPGKSEMRQVMDCFRLHRVMNWLSLAADRRFPEDKVVKLLDRAEEVGSLVL